MRRRFFVQDSRGGITFSKHGKELCQVSESLRKADLLLNFNLSRILLGTFLLHLLRCLLFIEM